MLRAARLALLTGAAGLLIGCGPKKSPEEAEPLPYGTSLETAAKVCGPEGQQALLGRLACPGGVIGTGERTGSLGSDAEGHIVDAYTVTCPDGQVQQLAVDLYHCDAPDPLDAIGFLELLAEPPPPPAEYWVPTAGGIPAEMVARIPERGVLLVLDDPGADPRQLLRYHPEEGSTERMEMTMLMGMEMEIGGNSSGAMVLPAMIMSMTTTIEEVADGHIRYTALVDEATVAEDGALPPASIEELRTSLAPLRGMTGYAIITDRGESLEAEFVLPPDAPPEMAQQMQSFSNSAENLAAPMPEEAVGVGARWSVYNRVNSSGFEIVQRADFVLQEIVEDRISLDVTIVQQPLVSNPQMDSMPPNMSMRMLSFDSAGEGRSVSDLGQLVPIASLVEIAMDFAFAMEGEGQSMEARMKMDMTMEITSGE